MKNLTETFTSIFKIGRTSIFVASLYFFEVLCLVCIMVVSYEAVNSEWISLLPIATFPVLASLVNIIFVVMMVLVLWLATDRTMFMLGVMARAKANGLRDIWGYETDFLQYLIQTVLIGSLAFGAFFLSLHFSTSGATLQLVKSIPSLQVQSIHEISAQFQRKETAIMKYYDNLRELEEKKYNRVISLRSVEMAQEAIKRLETSKENAIQAIRNDKVSEIERVKNLKDSYDKTVISKQNSGKLVGMSFEFLAVLCAVAIQIFSKPKKKESSEIAVKPEISPIKPAISPAISTQDIESLILQHYKNYKSGAIKQFEIAKMLNTSTTKVSRVFSDYEEKIAVTHVGDWASTHKAEGTITKEWIVK